MAEPVALGFEDKVTTPEDEPPGEFGARPFPLAPASIEVRPGEVSVLRKSAFPSLEFPPPPEDEEYVPSTDLSVLCR